MHEIRRAARIGLAFERLSLEQGLRHVVSTRGRDGEGNLSLSGSRDRDAALVERRYWSQWVGVDARQWVVGGQVHGANVARVGEDHRGRGAEDPAKVVPGADGLVTATRELPLYVAMADCAAALLYGAGEAPVLGLVHAGWRGLRDGVLRSGVEAACALGERPSSSLLAGISPCIGLSHFEVGDEVATHAPDTRRVKVAGRWHVDLAGWANDQLLDAGLTQPAIEVSGLDTHERADLFFSHRRDGAETGRMGMLAVLAAPPESAGPPRA